MSENDNVADITPRLCQNENVVTITGSSVSEASEAVASELRHLLEKAESGEIDGLAYAVSHSDGSSSIGRKGMTSHAVIGGLSRIQHHLLGEMSE